VQVGTDGFRLRPLAPDDGPAIAALFSASPDTGMVRFRASYRIDPYAALVDTPHEHGIVAERPGLPGLAGLGMVKLGVAVVRGAPRPFALLHSLVVHPDARRRGLAGALIDRRLDLARETLGHEPVVVATIQKQNAASFQAAARWATQLTGPLRGTALGLRSSPPSIPAGIHVRPATPNELEAYSAGYADYHAEFDLWPSTGAAELAEWLAYAPVPAPVRELWVVADGAGNLLAGLGLTETRRVATLHVEAMPRVMRLVNGVLRIVPTNGAMEQVTLSWMWLRPGAEGAARALFETVRWEARSRGNVLLATYDPRSRVGSMIRAPFWHPATQFSLAIRAPEPIRRNRLIESVQG
jgi:GNAT superfamily N-acetyltransferase